MGYKKQKERAMHDLKECIKLLESDSLEYLTILYEKKGTEVEDVESFSTVFNKNYHTINAFCCNLKYLSDGAFYERDRVVSRITELNSMEIPDDARIN